MSAQLGPEFLCSLPFTHGECRSRVSAQTRSQQHRNLRSVPVMSEAETGCNVCCRDHVFCLQHINTGVVLSPKALMTSLSVSSTWMALMQKYNVGKPSSNTYSTVVNPADDILLFLTWVQSDTMQTFYSGGWGGLAGWLDSVTCTFVFSPTAPPENDRRLSGVRQCLCQ